MTRRIILAGTALALIAAWLRWEWVRPWSLGYLDTDTHDWWWT